MGKSIYQQLIDGQVEVDHNGETLGNVKLPEWMQEIGSVLSQELDQADEEGKIMDILVENEIFSGFMAMALQQSLVAFRARVRPTDIANPELKGDIIRVSILDDEKNARERGLAFKPQSLRRPKKEATPEETAKQAIKILMAKGMSIEEIMEMI